MNAEFDTLLYTKRAMAVGFTASQAEFQAEEMAALLSQTVVTRFVLKQELTDLEIRLRTFQYQIAGTILGGLATVITVLEAIFHFVWR